MIRGYLILVFLLFLYACGNIEWVINENNNDKFYKNRTLISFSGDKKEIFTQELFFYFGKADKQEYVLDISFKENRENRLVKKNQVAEKTDFEMIINYKLYSSKKGCEIYNKKIITKFSFVPKSFGYNFGTDKSLEKLYKNSIKKNISDFIRLAPKNEDLDCL